MSRWGFPLYPFIRQAQPLSSSNSGLILRHKLLEQPCQDWKTGPTTTGRGPASCPPTWLCPSKGIRMALAGALDKSLQMVSVASSRSHSPLAQTFRQEQRLLARDSLWTDKREEPQMATKIAWTDRWTGQGWERSLAASWEESWKEFQNPWKDEAQNWAPDSKGWKVQVLFLEAYTIQEMTLQLLYRPSSIQIDGLGRERIQVYLCLFFSILNLSSPVHKQTLTMVQKGGNPNKKTNNPVLKGKGSEQTFLQKRYSIANKNMKR